MRKLKTILAVICLLACMTALCACGKQEKTSDIPASAAETESPSTGEYGIADEGGESYAGDRLARILTNENSVISFEYYDGADIGDYAKINVDEYTPTGEKDGVSLEEIKLYNAYGGQWSDAEPDFFVEGVYVVVTTDTDTGKIDWITIVG